MPARPRYTPYHEYYYSSTTDAGNKWQTYHNNFHYYNLCIPGDVYEWWTTFISVLLALLWLLSSCYLAAFDPLCLPLLVAGCWFVCNLHLHALCSSTTKCLSRCTGWCQTHQSRGPLKKSKQEEEISCSLSMPLSFIMPGDHVVSQEIDAIICHNHFAPRTGGKCYQSLQAQLPWQLVGG